VVLQEPILFSTTIARNIACGRPRALKFLKRQKQADAHNFISSLPLGYETPVGDRGNLLSGGERQRISIARAFLKNAPLLILDEPTSALDAQTEMQILDAMERLISGRTSFLISHRMAALSNCDLILKLSRNAVPEVILGTDINDLALKGLPTEEEFDAQPA
jgi:ATP-binding cassette subfamily B protein